jgi:hypothetical protein
MCSMSVPFLDLDERDALRSQVILDLRGARDLVLALEHDEVLLAQDLRDRLEQSLVLMDDLGWDRRDRRTSFRLSPLPSDLRPIIERIRHDVRDRIASELAAAVVRRPLREKDLEQAARIEDACLTILTALDDEEGEPH